MCSISGIYAELVAFAEDRQSWTVDYAYFEGATDNPQAGAWLELDAYWRRPVLRCMGAGAVCRCLRRGCWRRRPHQPGDGMVPPSAKHLCDQGDMPGRNVPAIGVPSNKSVTKRGKRKKFGSARVWAVGTWSLKSEFYANLHKTGQAAGEPFDPPGYCHFAKWQGEEYFKQITAEYFEQKMKNGRYHEEWKRIRSDNHLLDCRVYAMAMAEHLGLTRMTKAEWEALRSRLLPSPDTDLLSPAAHNVQKSIPEKVPLNRAR
jgi:phage terminase large subunit GpA-like protein